MKWMQYFISMFILAIVLFFASCENTNTPTKIKAVTKNLEEVYLEKGHRIASATFATLSGNLQKAMKEGGVSNAVKYCNLSASPMVDSLENVYQAKIRRTSLKTRNPKNLPTTNETEQLTLYQKQVESNEKFKPTVLETNTNTISFYAPIHMMPMCQKCHGQIGNTLSIDDYQVIQNLYPEDKAIGFEVGDLRGMWSISFPK